MGTATKKYVKTDGLDARGRVVYTVAVKSRSGPSRGRPGKKQAAAAAAAAADGLDRAAPRRPLYVRRFDAKTATYAYRKLPVKTFAAGGGFDTIKLLMGARSFKGKKSRKACGNADGKKNKSEDCSTKAGTTARYTFFESEPEPENLNLNPKPEKIWIGFTGPITLDFKKSEYGAQDSEMEHRIYDGVCVYKYSWQYKRDKSGEMKRVGYIHASYGGQHCFTAKVGVECEEDGIWDGRPSGRFLERRKKENKRYDLRFRQYYENKKALAEAEEVKIAQLPEEEERRAARFLAMQNAERERLENFLERERERKQQQLEYDNPAEVERCLPAVTFFTSVGDFRLGENATYVRLGVLKRTFIAVEVEVVNTDAYERKKEPYLLTAARSVLTEQAVLKDLAAKEVVLRENKKEENAAKEEVSRRQRVRQLVSENKYDFSFRDKIDFWKFVKTDTVWEKSECATFYAKAEDLDPKKPMQLFYRNLPKRHAFLMFELDLVLRESTVHMDKWYFVSEGRENEVPEMNLKGNPFTYVYEDSRGLLLIETVSPYILKGNKRIVLASFPARVERRFEDETARIKYVKVTIDWKTQKKIHEVLTSTYPIDNVGFIFDLEPVEYVETTNIGDYRTEKRRRENVRDNTYYNDETYAFSYHIENWEFVKTDTAWEKSECATFKASPGVFDGSGSDTGKKDTRHAYLLFTLELVLVPDDDYIHYRHGDAKHPLTYVYNRITRTLVIETMYKSKIGLAIFKIHEHEVRRDAEGKYRMRLDLTKKMYKYALTPTYPIDNTGIIFCLEPAKCVEADAVDAYIAEENRCQLARENNYGFSFQDRIRDWKFVTIYTNDERYEYATFTAKPDYFIPEAPPSQPTLHAFLMFKLELILKQDLELETLYASYGRVVKINENNRAVMEHPFTYVYDRRTSTLVIETEYLDRNIKKKRIGLAAFTLGETEFVIRPSIYMSHVHVTVDLKTKMIDIEQQPTPTYRIDNVGYVFDLEPYINEREPIQRRLSTFDLEPYKEKREPIQRRLSMGGNAGRERRLLGAPNTLVPGSKLATSGLRTRRVGKMSQAH